MKSKAKAGQRSDDEIAALVKNKLADALEKAKDVDAIVALSNALSKWQHDDEGEWGAELPRESRSLNSEPVGDSARR